LRSAEQKGMKQNEITQNETKGKNNAKRNKILKNIMKTYTKII